MMPLSQTGARFYLRPGHTVGTWRIVRRQLGAPDQTQRVRGSREEAERALVAWRGKLVVESPETATPRTTLAEWLTLWLSRQHRLTPKSQRTYQQHIDRLMLGSNWQLGAKQLCKLTAEDIETWHIAAMDHWRLSRNTVRNTLRFAIGGLDHAVKRGLLAANPFADFVQPSTLHAPQHCMTPAELARLANIPEPRTRLLLTLAAHTGMRRGELLALTWRHVDMTARTLTVAASLDWDRRAAGAILKGPKTRAGRRTIELPAAAMRELNLARLEANSFAVTTGRAVEDLTVIRGDDGGHYSPDAASQAALRALRSAKLPGSLHSLRHTHATLLLGAKVSAHVVARRLGHSSVGITLGLYAHAMAADGAAAVSAWDQATGEGRRRANIAGIADD